MTLSPILALACFLLKLKEGHFNKQSNDSCKARCFFVNVYVRDVHVNDESQNSAYPFQQLEKYSILNQLVHYLILQRVTHMNCNCN